MRLLGRTRVGEPRMVRHGIPNEKSPESVWAPAHDRGAARRVAGQLLSTGAMNANPCRVAVTYRRHELAEPAQRQPLSTAPRG